MFKIEQTAQNRYRIGCVNCNDYSALPRNIGTSIHWATFATAQEAFARAAQWWFQICDGR